MCNSKTKKRLVYYQTTDIYLSNKLFLTELFK